MSALAATLSMKSDFVTVGLLFFRWRDWFDATNGVGRHSLKYTRNRLFARSCWQKPRNQRRFRSVASRHQRNGSVAGIDNVGAGWQDRTMTLSRITWAVVLFICLVGAVLLMIAGYRGYSVLAVAVGLAAALNLS